MANAKPSQPISRKEAIKLIRYWLKKRSGKRWSVTGGRGTGWGWLKITAPPSRRSPHPCRYMSEPDRAELGKLLGQRYLPNRQGLSVPASSDHYRQYINLARGFLWVKPAEDYWD